MIALIVAVAENGVIGNTSGLPWHLPADLLHFKNTTMGHPIIMGRKTHESIGRALPGRKNIVIARDKSYQAVGCNVVHSPEEALAVAGTANDVFVIGGGEIYRLMFPYAEKLFVTSVHHSFEGDVRFPDVDWTNWKEVGREDFPSDEKNPYSYSFLVFERIT